MNRPETANSWKQTAELATQCETRKQFGSFRKIQAVFRWVLRLVTPPPELDTTDSVTKHNFGSISKEYIDEDIY